ncbi:Transposon Tf2-1 polyprotein [Rhizoctonia solani]|uniref:Transposon Tf2-1 polyprotein n=1 Tax=Rhizoctonia solani TaxID=456999 RepID=A0A8H8P5L6_9AGAM|nr:Transposon Tf2-1 polyprotein [Rhizoctonia solani]QRW25610.1 Transposon Tf2-1 polyprotein [Rhizoctonia solani]
MYYFNSQFCNNTCLSVPNSILGNIGGTYNHLEGLPEDLGGVEVIEPLEGIPRETGGTVDSPLESILVELHNFAEVFSEDMKVTELPLHCPFDLGIDLINPDKPVKAMVYPLKTSDDEELRKLLKEQLDKALICPSKSKYGSPVHFVKSCSLIEKLRGAKYFSTIDLKSGYNLVRIKEGDEWQTAFKTKYGLFEYLVMPFGLCNAPAAFQHFMNEIFRDILDVHIVVYLDNILIFSESRELHTKHLQEVLKRLQDNACYCNLEKCNFYASEVDYLDVIANGEGVKADPKKITQAVDWATLCSVKGVQEFLGFINFYRHFIHNFSKLAQPLYQLPQKNIPWESFKALKLALIESPVLIQPDPYKEFFLECDAPDLATGAVLKQKGSDDKLHPVAFLSKSLAPAERNYDIFDKELLAVVRALKEWRHLLEGTVILVKILTDHKNLEYFQTKRDLNQRQLRWMGFLADYNYRIVYRPGAQNRKAYILSCNEDHKSAVKEGGETPVLISPELFIAAIQTDSDLNDLIRDALHDDKAVHKILKSLEEDIPVKGWKIDNGLLYYHDWIYVPNEPEIRRAVLESRHDNPSTEHPGQFRTLDLLSRDYYWSGMKQSVTKYVQVCNSCICSKHSNQAPEGLLQNIDLPNKPWEEIMYDLIVGLPTSEGYDAILTVVDCLSQMVHFIPMHSDATAVDVANLFVSFVWKLHGLPRKTILDQGPQFNAKFLRQVYKCLGIEPHFSTAYRPQVDGQSECLNQFVEIYLCHYINYRQTDWVA